MGILEVFDEGGAAVEIMSGFLAEFDHKSILRRDLRHLGQARETAIGLTVEHSGLAVVELLIGGWDNDPRGLYEVPEVRRWVGLAQERWPDLLFWLTPDSLRTCLLSLNPHMFQRLPGGNLRIMFDTEWLTEQMSVSLVAGMRVLRAAGMPERQVDRSAGQARSSLTGMLEEKRLGDYVVVHPGERAVITYRE
jgi:hypothetical protein